jgi:hypothetical protein
MEMRHGSGLRALAALVLLGVIGLITAGAYGAGFAAGQGSGTTSNLAPWAYGGAFGAGHLVGFVLTILVLIMLFRLIAVVLFGGHRRAWGHHGYWHGDVDPSRGPGFGPSRQGFGPGGWHRSEWRQAGQAAFDEFHRQAHANQAATPGTTPGGAPGTTGADQPR